MGISSEKSASAVLRKRGLFVRVCFTLFSLSVRLIRVGSLALVSSFSSSSPVVAMMMWINVVSLRFVISGPLIVISETRNWERSLLARVLYKSD